MATTPLRITTPFPSLHSLSTRKPHAFSKQLFTVRATDVESTEDTTQPDSTPTESSDEFESRLSNIRLRYRSGTGKKAEVRKSKKGSSSAAGGSSKSSGLYLPPVSLKEPVSGGLKVELGFTPYTERLNGRMAGLGLVALLLVELATGKSLLSYHTPSVVWLQIYFMAAVSAMYVKIEKEKVSVWPKD
ncbi:FKBP-type peptidyl-prolyl cis-trans isomerase [Hirschfeldia incana]|nr:FKBP-type peptidyl-prolyl cis-trans isomerase [Hirschfeldia incana]